MGLYNKDAQYDFSIRIREALNRIELTIKELTEEEIAAKNWPCRKWHRRSS